LRRADETGRPTAGFNAPLPDHAEGFGQGARRDPPQAARRESRI